MEVEITETAKPLTLIDTHFRDVAVILSAHKAFKAHGMRDSYLWTVEVDRQSLLLGVDIGDSRIVIDAHIDVGHSDFLHLVSIQCEVVQIACSTVALPAYTGIKTQSPIGLVGKGEPLSMIEEHLVLRCRTEGHEDIVLVVLQVVIGRRHDVTGHLKGNIPHRELEGTVFLLVERVGQHMSCIPFVALRTIGSIAVPEEMRIERSHGTTSQAKTYAVYIVFRQIGVDRTEVELTFLSARTTSYLHIVLHESLYTQNDPLETFGIFHAVDETVHR